jgi:hypothetical protein
LARSCARSTGWIDVDCLRFMSFLVGKRMIHEVAHKYT